MNIKITVNEHIRLLNMKCEEDIIIGSHLYGTNNEDSDTDYLCFYEPPPEWDNMHLPNIHQFQYDDLEDNSQYIWTTWDQFWKNQASGDSTINTDVLLFSKNHPYTHLDTLGGCRTQKVIRAYLGLARRDIDNYKRGKNKLFHAHRGVYMANKLMNNEMPTLKGIRNLSREGGGDTIYAKKLKSICSMLRTQCTNMFNDGDIDKYWLPDTDDKLLQKLFNSNNIKEFKYD